VHVSDPTEFVAQTLRLWRLADHGAVAMLGHRVPAPGTRQRVLFDKLVSGERSLARYERWITAFMPMTRDAEEPYFIFPVVGSSSKFVSLARFMNSPYDTTLLVAERAVLGSGSLTSSGRWITNKRQVGVSHSRRRIGRDSNPSSGRDF
jgi:hypothetical protein